MSKAPRPFAIRVNKFEASVILEYERAGGFQDFHRSIADQLQDGRLEVVFDDEGLGKLIRLMTQYGSGGFQGALKKAFRRNLGRMIAGYEQL